MANEVEADSFTSHQRCTILISVTMRKTILADLSSLDTPSSKSYAALMGILKKRFPPKSLVISERYHFHTREVSSTSKKLKHFRFSCSPSHLASTCNFGTHLNKNLWDRSFCMRFTKQSHSKEIAYRGCQFWETTSNCPRSKSCGEWSCKARPP